jgi:hypothetical protein
MMHTGKCLERYTSFDNLYYFCAMKKLIERKEYIDMVVKK